MNILIIEDSAILLQALKDGLTKLGYAVDAVADGKVGLDYAKFKDYDVIILDLMLPGMDGLSILKNLRAMGKKTHVLILSARDQVEDRVRGLQLGADDYMVKPFSFDELCARIGTLIRRQYDNKNPEVILGSITVNTALRKVKCGGKIIALTPGEYAIIEYLLHNRGRVVSVEQLLDTVHDSEAAPGTNVIQVMVCNLRKKLSQECGDDVVKTRRGYGYYIE
jgi:DNA-binding response OmpR family regulator